MRILFIGNSATYVHDIPETLARLATEAGYPTECVRVVKGGWKLSQHAEAGSRALAEIEKGYDIVVLQDNEMQPILEYVINKYGKDFCDKLLI